MNIFMKTYGVDQKSICLLTITHLGKDLAVQRWAKPQPNN